MIGRLAVALLAAGWLVPVAAAQNALTIDQNVGLHLLPAGSTVPIGTVCSWFTCAVHQAGPLPRGVTHLVQVYGKPKSPYVVAIDAAPTRCSFYPFVCANGLALNQPVIVGFGATSGALPGYPCNVGTDTWLLPIPATVPAGLDVLLQGCVIQNIGWMSSFTPAVQAQTL